MAIRRARTHAFAAGMFLRRLLHSRAGNTLAIAAAALLPIIGIIGGGVDMGRGYLSESRLQQACDAGVLAARKRVGTEAAVSGTIPEDAAATGQSFFNVNFPDGSYGTGGRAFDMTLEEDMTVSGTATVHVPTTLMAVFGYQDIPIEVNCSAQLNMANTDVMMVLDVTGSMATINPGDSVSRIQALKDTVRSFHAQLTAAAPVSSRVRFGFVPYSANVNVGGLLRDDWVVDDWHYQSREWIKTGKALSTNTYDQNWTAVSGSRGEPTNSSSYPATYHPATGGGGGDGSGGSGGTAAYYTCDTPAPASTTVWNDWLISTSSAPYAGPPSGTKTTEVRQWSGNGTEYWLELNGSTCLVKRQVYSNYNERYERVTVPVERDVFKWRYARLNRDVSNWRAESNGCMEERDTYEITDYDNVDLSRARDLDIDSVPTGDDGTKWRPMYPWIVYARSWDWWGYGSWTVPPQVTLNEYILPAAIGFSACPAPARKLSVMTAQQISDYIDTLQPIGSTYHDIGMIWGGRLLSPNGLFASENADTTATRPTQRNLIFLTDGETAPLDFSYASYGLEPLDQRRWSTTSPLTLKQTVEKRFTFACDEVKRHNVTVWIVMFGTDDNPIMQDCAGAGHYFVASDAAELETAFSTIAKRMGELRVTR